MKSQTIPLVKTKYSVNQIDLKNEIVALIYWIFNVFIQ